MRPSPPAVIQCVHRWPAMCGEPSCGTCAAFRKSPAADRRGLAAKDRTPLLSVDFSQVGGEAGRDLAWLVFYLRSTGFRTSGLRSRSSVAGEHQVLIALEVPGSSCRARLFAEFRHEKGLSEPLRSCFHRIVESRSALGLLILRRQCRPTAAQAAMTKVVFPFPAA